MAEFVDEALLHVTGGDGGHGCASIKREKFKPLGGPDGGNGGRGGDVILEVDPGATTLLDFHHRPVRRAGNGKPGQGYDRNGADGADLVLAVPDGTVVKTADGKVLADLVGAGTRFVAAAGGRGGLGNAALASRGARRPASRCWGARRGARPRARAEVARRRRAGRLPQRRASRRWSPRCPPPGPRSPTTRSPP